MEDNSRDWVCQKCKESNFRKRYSCRKCGTNKNANVELGDWLCLYCNKHNFKKNDVCKFCNANKKYSINKNCINNFDNVKKYNQPIKEIGDWTCNCGELNFKKKIICRKCNKNILLDPIDESDENTGNSNTKCVVCLTEEKSFLLTKCRHFILCEICVYLVNKCPLCKVQYTDNDIMHIFNC